MAFITCSTGIEQTSLKGTRPYKQQEAASFSTCSVMIACGVSAFFSFQDWQGVGSKATTSQRAGSYASTTCAKHPPPRAEGCGPVTVQGGPLSQPKGDYTCFSPTIRRGLTQHS